MIRYTEGRPDGPPVVQELPAVGLTDGRGGLAVTVGFFSELAWNRLRGTTLPPLDGLGPRIEFPPLPSG